MNSDISPPKLMLSMTEIGRSTLEAGSLIFKLNGLVNSVPRGDRQPVLVIPGYGGSDGSVAVLRYFLNKINYSVFPLGLGRNYESPDDRIMRIEDAVAFREKMTEQVIKRVEILSAQEESKITLVGWSMGGLYAFDASQIRPDLCRQVITLGSPFGDPRGTAAFKLLRKINGSDIPIEHQNFDLWNEKTKVQSNEVPISVLHSAKDGIVGKGIQRLQEHPCVEHHLVDSSHIGFSVNPRVYEKLASIIGQ